MNIKAFKLVTGEEIIGTITEETPEEVNLKNVLIVATQYNQDGKASIGFVAQPVRSNDNTTSFFILLPF